MKKVFLGKDGWKAHDTEAWQEHGGLAGKHAGPGLRLALQCGSMTLASHHTTWTAPAEYVLTLRAKAGLPRSKMDAKSFPPFVPHPLVRGAHLQTIFGSLAGVPRIAYSARQHVVDLEDGDQVVLHDDCPANWRSGHRVALLLHGVSGSHASPYLVRVAARLNAVGVRVFRLDMRGCGAGARLAHRPGHAGRSEDVAAVIGAISRLCPASRITLVGYSMGGNIVLKLLGESGNSPPDQLDRAIAVAPPIDLAACCEQIERGLINRVYQRNFVGRLIAQTRQRRQFSQEIAAIPLRPRPRRISAFDQRFTAPLSGFQGVDDYYRRCSAAPLLASVRIPTLVITAANDPLVPVELFHRYRRSEAIELHVSPCGGHLGFYGVSGIDPDRWWLDWRIVDCIGPVGNLVGWTPSSDTPPRPTPPSSDPKTA